MPGAPKKSLKPSDQPVRNMARGWTCVFTTLAPYRVVLVDSAIHGAKWLPEAAEFVRRHRTALEQLPLIYFLVCTTLREDTAEHHREVLAYLDPVRAIL